MNSKITLTSRVESIRMTRDVSPPYVKQLGYSVTKFGNWLGHAPTVGDLQSDTVNRYLLWLTESGKWSKQTIRTQRRNLLVLWHDCIEEGLTDAITKRVRKIKTPRAAPNAWTAADMAKLLAAADKLVGVSKKSRVPRAAFWRAFLLTGWDSGLRLGDLLLLTTEQVRGKSEFVVVQHKTGWPVTVRLWPNTIAAIEATYPPEREKVFSGFCRQKIFVGFRALVKAAGVSKGGSHKVRRSSATAMEIACPGSATAHLDHLTPDLAFKHYLDQSQIQRHKPLPPPLPEAPQIAGLLPAPRQEGGDDAT